MSHQTIILTLGVLVVLVLGLLRAQITEAPTPSVNPGLEALKQAADGKQVLLSINEALITAEIAQSDAARARGLSGRSVLDPDKGLLFIFPQDGKPGFWMKEMNFAIDIVWINSTGVVIEVMHDLQPNSFPRLFYPSTPIRYVLELPAGGAQQKDIKPGDIIHLIDKNHT